MSDEIRVLTYTKNQPSNNEAYRIYQAFRDAKPGGDFIDHGLSITQELQKRGLGIAVLPAIHDTRHGDPK